MNDYTQIAPAAGCRSGTGSFLMIGSIALAVLAAGLWVAKQSGESVDLQMRGELARQAASIASAVGPVPVRELSFSDEDRGRPAFSLLCSQMAAYAEAAGLRSLYMMALRNGHLVFGPESLPEGDPYASAPGTVYQKPGERDFEIFYTGRPQVQGPAQDEYGTFVTASAPIIDPLNGEVLAVIGIDVAAADWQAVVRRAQWIPGGVTLVLIGILVLSAIILRFRNRVTPSRFEKFSSAESVLSAVFMTSLTLALALYLHWIEGNARRDTFCSLAQAQAVFYAGTFSSVDAEMNHLKTFFESSETVTDGEFSLYCRQNAGFAAIQNAFWIPEVKQESSGRFADSVRAAGLPGFSIWQTNERGERETAGGRPFYYPVLYVHPAVSLAMTGYDIGSNPFLYDAIRRAKETGQNTATKPIAPGSPTNPDPLIYIFKPINASVQTGLVAFAVQPEKLQGGRPVKNLRSHDLEVCLSQLEAGQPPLLITGSSPACSDACWIKGRSNLSLRVPVFAFDSTYALHFIPETSWLADHPLTSGWRTGMGGMILTLLGTGLVALITNRRVTLERLVERRTSELKAGRQLLDGILNTIPVRVFWKDKNLRFSGCNVAFARDAGLSGPHEIIGKDDYEMVWRDQADLYRDDDRRVIESGIPKLLIEEPQTTPDGKTITLLTSKIPLRDANGEICGVLGTCLDITDRKQAEERIHSLARHLETVREEERKRLSRELHDDIGQILTALKIDLMMVMGDCICAGPVKSRMSDMQNLLGEGIQSVHSLCRRLRPGALDDLSLEDALDGLIGDWETRNQIECKMTVDLDDASLSDAVKTAVFRMVQESLTNVSRYAQASHVEICLVSDSSALHVSVADNGCGMVPGAAEKPASFGLLGMRERLEALGGTLYVESALGKGTRIEASLPLQGGAA